MANKKIFFSLFFSFLVSFSPLNLLPTLAGDAPEADAAEAYRSPGIKQNNAFQRKGSPCILRCREVVNGSHLGFESFSFDIIGAKGSPHEAAPVGRIAVKYSQRANQTCEFSRVIEIGHLEVKEGYRRNGYGEGALRIALGIFRSPKQEHLLFDRFFLSVDTGQGKKPARNLYEKLGFKVGDVFHNIGCQSMFLPRNPAS